MSWMGEQGTPIVLISQGSRGKIPSYQLFMEYAGDLQWKNSLIKGRISLQETKGKDILGIAHIFALDLCRSRNILFLSITIIEL